MDKFEIILDENGAIHFYYNDVEMTKTDLEKKFSRR